MGGGRLGRLAADVKIRVVNTNSIVLFSNLSCESVIHRCLCCYY